MTGRVRALRRFVLDLCLGRGVCPSTGLARTLQSTPDRSQRPNWACRMVMAAAARSGS
jgi:hypothetical protein